MDFQLISIGGGHPVRLVTLVVLLTRSERLPECNQIKVLKLITSNRRT